MYSGRLLTLLVPAAVVVAEEKSEDKQKPSNLSCRPSELPIYVADLPPPLANEGDSLSVPSSLENGFGTVRRHVTDVYKEIKAYQRVGLDYLEQSKENTEWLLKYLRQEDNTTPKAGAIAIGGLTGYIFGLRGGLFKRVVYTATGALGMAAVCYPKEASEYTRITLEEVKKYATITYNFAYGVKKDDPPLELPSLPSIPSSLSEAWNTVSKSASSLISGAEPDTQVIRTKEVAASAGQIAEAHEVVAKVHGTSSQSCECPLGASLGHDKGN